MSEEFRPQFFDIKNINGGNRFNDGDSVSAYDINSAIEGAAFAIEESYNTSMEAKTAVSMANVVYSLAENQPNTETANNVGTPSVSVEDHNGGKRFVFANLKGERGEKGEKGDAGYGVKFYAHRINLGGPSLTIISTEDQRYQTLNEVVDAIQYRSGFRPIYDESGVQIGAKLVNRILVTIDYATNVIGVGVAVNQNGATLQIKFIASNDVIADGTWELPSKFYDNLFELDGVL